MNMLFIKHFVVGVMVSKIPRVSVFGHCSYSCTVRIRTLSVFRHCPYSVTLI